MSGAINFIEKYLKLGLAIIPVRKETKISYIKWKEFIEEAPAPVQVYEWFKTFPNANIGALMGRVSGNVIALDVDFRSGGEQSIQNLELPDTFTSRTGDGLHYFYRSQNCIQKKICLFHGIDLIAGGGYCVMPPSQHNSGSCYEILQDLPIAPAPEWLSAALLSKTDDDTTNAALIPVGQRHNTVLRSIRAYATNTVYFTQLWKRSYGLAIKCCESSKLDILTIGELFNLCLWAWNAAHPNDKFNHDNAWKLLSGSARRRPDIYLGPVNESIHINYAKNQQRKDSNPIFRILTSDDINKLRVTGGN